MRPRSLVPVLAFGALSGSLLGAACKPAVATPEECEKVSDHLADLVVKKEKKPPFGRLASPPFNTPDNEKDIRDEAKGKAKPRCLKGWKRQVFDCMMAAQDIESADKCRFE